MCVCARVCVAVCLFVRERESRMKLRREGEEENIGGVGEGETNKILALKSKSLKLSYTILNVIIWCLLINLYRIKKQKIQ